MDELAFFFSDDLYSTEDIQKCGFTKTATHQDHSRTTLGDQQPGDIAIIKNKSEPSFTSPRILNAFLQSSSFSGTNNLPLNLPPEPEDGNIEYKLKLISPTPDRLEHLVTQMKWRLNEGGGQAIYRLGVDDNGAVTGLTAKEMSASLLTLYKMSQRLGVHIRILRECTISNFSDSSDLQHSLADARPSFNPQRKAIELHAKWKLLINQGIPDLRVAMLGSVDVGKSTLLGVLTDGEMDDGRGRARLNLFRHLHEVQSGRTSSLSSELIGFDAAGHLINRRRSQGQLNKRTVDEVIRDSNRLITFLDLAGHSKYQRTTLSGLTTFQPTFCILVVSATTGLTADGLRHARTSAALGLPLVVVFSKVDLTSEGLAAFLQSKVSVASAARFITTDASAGGVVDPCPILADIRRSVLQELRTIKFYSSDGGEEGSLTTSECFVEDPPVFAVSSVSGYGVGNLLNFLAEVSSKAQYEGIIAPKLAVRAELHCAQSMCNLVECWVTKVFSSVPGVDSPILEVLVKMGQVHEDQRLWLGPDEEGLFHQIRVIELRHNRHPHHVLYKDQLGSLLAVPETPDGTYFPLPRKGMVMVSAEPTVGCSVADPSIGVCWSFCISNLIWLAPSTGGTCLQRNSTVGVHAGNVLQYARVLETTFSCDQLTRAIDCLGVDSNSVILRLDSSHKVVVSFIRQPEFLELGRQVVISVNNVARAVGTVAAFKRIITAFSNPPPQSFRSPSPTVSESTFSTTAAAASSSSPWHTVSNSPSDSSYEALLSQIGIDPQGSHTNFIDEPPIPPELEAFENLSSLTQRNKRRQRNAKRRRKAAARLALMAASASEVTSSTSTWNSNSNGSVSLLMEQGEKEMKSEEVKMDTSQGLINFATIANASTCNAPSQRSRKRKRRHKR
ncbi:GTP-binding protein 2 [Echinococcus granulosus]|uniref:GTP-binding protein n=1 Tax=Echinococcus granulosus TaxID=6210 RepID=U6J1S8_ECHGR|nr:GTP-binding protein [Echinococcus granulosus]EUB64375.1 GTP-binding protein [Echinococcus granulosus]KAH9283457.1 GTP-binding protein 2 [Echinococcus granulosus]CDS17246.1 gtp binding protein 2 [Echinococcus granulosus]